MAGAGSMLTLQLMLFCLMAAGYLFGKINILRGQVRAGLNELLISLVLPCNILSAYMVDEERGVFLSLGVALAVGVGIQMLALLVARLAWRNVPENKRKVLQYGTIVSNAGFLGNPVAEGLYGSQGLLYATAYMVPMRIMMWTAGLACFTPTTGRAAFKKVIRHPCIIATVLGIVLLATGLRPPAFLGDAVRALGACNTPLAMLVIGGILSEVDLKTVLKPLNLVYCLVRLVALPLAVLGILLLLRPADIIIKVSVVLVGMPMAATTALLAGKYKGDAGFASGVIFLSTLLSMATIPLLAALVDAVV